MTPHDSGTTIEARPRKSRGWSWRILAVGVVLGLLHVAAWQLGWTKVTTPGDVVLNLRTTISEPAWDAQPVGERHLVVLAHGVGRSAWSLWQLERLLRNHGYEVWNETYDGAATGILELGADLGTRLEAYISASNDARPLRLYGVAHSMGGLVLRSYLQRQSAREFRALVFLGTPNQGAMLATELRDRWYFSLALGSKAARDLAPEEGVIARLGSVPPHLGNVIGGKSDGTGWSASIPGDDDGRVAVTEAHLDNEADAVLVNVSHTFLPVNDDVHRQVLHFLRHRHFAR